MKNFIPKLVFLIFVLIFSIGKYMKFFIFLFLIVFGLIFWNKFLNDNTNPNAGVTQPANTATVPVTHEPTLTDSLSRWFVDHTPKK